MEKRKLFYFQLEAGHDFNEREAMGDSAQAAIEKAAREFTEAAKGAPTPGMVGPKIQEDTIMKLSRYWDTQTARSGFVLTVQQKVWRKEDEE